MPCSLFTRLLSNIMKNNCLLYVKNVFINIIDTSCRSVHAAGTFYILSNYNHRRQQVSLGFNVRDQSRVVNLWSFNWCSEFMMCATNGVVHLSMSSKVTMDFFAASQISAPFSLSSLICLQLCQFCQYSDDGLNNPVWYDQRLNSSLNFTKTFYVMSLSCLIVSIKVLI